MKQKINLEKILSQLTSDEVRAAAIRKLMRKVELSPQQIEMAVEVYEKTERFWDAVEVAKGAGLTERAIKNYEKAERFSDAEIGRASCRERV